MVFQKWAKILFALLVFGYIIYGEISSYVEKKHYRYYTKVFMVSNGSYVDVPNDQIKDPYDLYVGKDGVAKNDTGKDLVRYSVKYSSVGSKNYEKPKGFIIKPEHYFYWDNKSEYTRLFTKPSHVATFIFHGKKYTEMYLEFLDYADEVGNEVNITSSY